MRNKALNESLRAVAVQAATRLSAELDAGAEIPFEVAENPGAHSVLYHYRPLSGQWVRERFAGLRSLPAFEPAVTALAGIEGCSAYLRVLGMGHVPAAQRDRAEAALREFLVRVWHECSDLELEDGRFDRAYGQLEGIVFEDSVINTVVAPLIGVSFAADRWELGSGLTLERGDHSDAPADAVWASGREDEAPNAIVTLSVESRPEQPAPVTEARMAFRKLLSAARLLKPGAAALGPFAWWRTDGGPWQAVPLGFSGRSRGNPYRLEASERPELTELFELLRSRSALGGPLPWALKRFESGCEQRVSLEALSDYLLAARALLDGGEPTPIGVSLRLAALCAEPADQRSVQLRVERAFALEHLIMRGDADAALLAARGIEAPEALVRDLEQDLRALLRDAIAGHLPADLRGVADEILAEPSSHPAATRPEPSFVVTRVQNSAAPDEQPTEEHQAVPVAPTADATWDLDDDAADYSAAI